MADILQYEVVAAALRAKGDTPMPEGVRTFNEYRIAVSEELTPRWVLFKHFIESCPGACDWQALADLWMLGAERAIYDELARRRDHLLEYEVEFIGGYGDRISLRYYGENTPDADLFAVLDDYEHKTPVVWQADWKQEPIIGMHGLHSVELKCLCEWPDGRRLFVVSAYEGEGWWGSMFFSVRITDTRADAH